jgi:hypothetical protein
MNELPTNTAVLILQYDTDNTYGINAARRAREALRKQKGVAEVSQDAFIIDIAETFKFLSSLVISEDRLFAGSADTRHLHFVLVPCQSPVVGALTEELKKKLGALGLTNWEIGYPEEPRPSGR